jgi:hypothetical protein
MDICRLHEKLQCKTPIWNFITNPFDAYNRHWLRSFDARLHSLSQISSPTQPHSALFHHLSFLTPATLLWGGGGGQSSKHVVDPCPLIASETEKRQGGGPNPCCCWMYSPQPQPSSRKSPVPLATWVLLWLMPGLCHWLPECHMVDAGKRLTKNGPIAGNKEGGRHFCVCFFIKCFLARIYCQCALQKTMLTIDCIHCFGN